MPISEEEYDNNRMSRQFNNVSPQYLQPNQMMSKAELRKCNKPIMEKRRRARINNCLNELKSLILDALNKDPSRHSKLEKADILEMTVKHLQSIQRQHMSTAVAADPSILARFQSGFSECANEVSQYISQLDGVEHGVKQRLTSHLSGCVAGLNQIAPFANSMTNRSTMSNVRENEDVNNNTSTARLQTELQLVPNRLSIGELSVLLPNKSAVSQTLLETVSTTTNDSTTIESRSYKSAFTAVARPRQSTTPPATPPLLKSDVVSSTTSNENDALLPKPLPITKPLTIVTCENQTHSLQPITPEEDGSVIDYSIKKTNKRPIDENLLMLCSDNKKICLESHGTAFKKVIKKQSDPSGSTSSSNSNNQSDMWRPW